MYVPTLQAARTVRLYWRAYGGFPALITSPYLWLSFVVTLAVSGSWMEVDKDGARTWPQLPLSLIPNILGFSMGGMAIALALSGSTFMKTITEGGKEDSYFMKLVAVFFHFILVQTASIMLGLIGKAYSSDWISFFGYWCMIYALLSTVSTAGQLFQTARIVNVAADVEGGSDEQSL